MPEQAVDARAKNKKTYDGFVDLTWPEYNALDAVRSSWLKAMKRSAAACRLAMRGGDKDTRALRLGRALHQRVLQPAVESVVLKDWDGRTKEGKERAASLPPGTIVLDRDDWDAVEGMADSLWTHPTISRMLANAQMLEQTVVWTRNGRLCKAQLDAGAGDWVADLKSTKDVQRFSPYEVEKYSYHCQAAWYLSAFHFLKITPPNHFYFFVVANTPPFESAVFRLDGASLGQGVEETNVLFDKFIQCETEDKWPRHETSLLVAKTFPQRQPS